VAKRASDVLGSLTFLLLFLPLLLVLGLLVKLNSRGPVLFRQVRLGYKGKPFTLLKFRTMYVDADHALHQTYMSWFINASDSSVASEDRAPFKMYNDPRVTSMGAFLRKTSFDELPQLWNVLRGEMSLVGPRPPIGYEVDQYEPWHRRRVMDVKPGMTGLWQIAGRSRTTFDQMVRLDLRYAKTCSLWNDIRILFATPGAMISGKGAR
jgi:lipopolysaccharide/colanic/teichoic acid biosynthesis glycosyltransferase